MTIPKYHHALIVGAGAGLSASFARKAAANGLKLSLAARDPGDLTDLCSETGAKSYQADAAELASVQALFEAVETAQGAPDLVLYNPSARASGPITEIDPEQVARAITITATGGFYVAQAAAKRMVPKGHGAILFTGATASLKAYGGSTAFAMGKFGLRALAQSLARELHPQGIHIGHFVIDGGIQNPNRPGRGPDPANPDALLDPDAIAETYWQHVCQDRSCWSWEAELRPWVEKF